MATTASAQSAGELSPLGRHAVRGAWMGFFVDMFDIYLPIIVLAPAIAYFIAPEMGQATIAIVGGTIFAATLIGRPMGAAIFGHIGDTVGRKRATILALSGSGVATLLMALLPGYALLGTLIVVIFVALRLINGIFVGGVYTSANPLAMEYSPKEKRGFYGALIMTGYPLAYAAISLITLVLLQFIPAGDLNSPYVQWGWRIPFLISTIMIFALVYYFVNSVAESQLFEAAHESDESEGESESPVIELFKGENLRSFLQVFVLMGGFWLTLYAPSAMLPPLLTNELGLSGTRLTITLSIAFLVLAAGYIAAGVIGQRIGRRLFLIVASIIMATVGTFLYYLIVAPTRRTSLP
ncbi:MAG TPA: MFS transporter [Rubrobacteraceae bacterium]|nr:MFS transporter [Rubrobacteraceae bacterium]